MVFPILANLLLGAEPGYVDSRICSDCHASIAASFAATGMARSLRPVTPESLTAPWQRHDVFRHDRSDRTYEMFLRDGRPFLLRYQDGPRGGPVHTVEKEIHFVLGSGNHAQTFLHRTPQGRLLDLPVAWYTAGAGRWAMAPGYDRADHVDYRREINDNCRFCHTAYPREGATTPEAIDCQRCHGPGQHHATRPARTNIVNPARLAAQRQIEICFQCHLQSTSERVWMERRPGRAVYSYRPGEPLGDYAQHIDYAPKPDSFEVNHAAYRLLDSACFKGSRGRLTCTTCHDPHARDIRPACANCHSNPSHGGDCVSCHMAKRRPDDAPEVVVTDHRIARRPPADRSPAPRDKAEPVALYPARPGRFRFRSDPAPEPSLNTRGEALYRQGRLPEAVATLRQAVSDNPDLPEARVNLGAALHASGDRAGAEREFEEAVRIAPESAAAHNNLANLIEARGDFHRAAWHFQKAVALDPGYHAAWFNYGRALAIRGRKDEAIPMLKRAAEAHDPALRDAARKALAALR